MGSLPVQPPARRSLPKLYLLVAATVFAAALAASLGAKPSVHVTMNGKPRSVPEGATIANLITSGYLVTQPGKLISVSGRLLRQDSPETTLIWRNGRLADRERVVFDGDVITSSSGAIVVEETKVVRAPVQFKTRTVGSGPLITLAAPGALGVRQTTVGTVSGEVVTSAVVVAPSAMIIKRYGRQGRQKVVALTFDDGPWPGQTEKILHILRQYKVKGSFFMLGYLAKRHHALARQVAKEGNLVGSHTMGHRKLTKLKPAAIDQQIADGQAAVTRSAGVTPKWFRPPGGNVSPTVLKRVYAEHLKVALWNVDPQDWRRPTSSQIITNVVTHVRPSSIVLLHDGGGDRTQTIKALPLLIRALQKRGYRFVTVDQLPKN